MSKRKERSLVCEFSAQTGRRESSSLPLAGQYLIREAQTDTAADYGVESSDDKDTDTRESVSDSSDSDVECESKYATCMSLPRH